MPKIDSRKGSHMANKSYSSSTMGDEQSHIRDKDPEQAKDFKVAYQKVSVCCDRKITDGFVNR